MMCLYVMYNLRFWLGVYHINTSNLVAGWYEYFTTSGYWLCVYGINTLQIAGYRLGVYGITRLLIR